MEREEEIGNKKVPKLDDKLLLDFTKSKIREQENVGQTRTNAGGSFEDQEKIEVQFLKQNISNNIQQIDNCTSFKSLEKESVYFINRKDKTKSSIVVLEGDQGKVSGSPTLEWDEWTTNSDESSTISVLHSGAGIKDEDFTPSKSFDYLNAQNKYETKENDKVYREFTKDNNYMPRIKPNSEDPFTRQYLGPTSMKNDKETSDVDSDATFKEYSDTQKIKSKSVPKLEEPEFGQSKNLRRDYSPNFRSRDNSATRFVAIDAYLGIKDKDAGGNHEPKRYQDHVEDKYNYYSSLERERHSRESRRTSKKKVEEVPPSTSSKAQEADIKEDLCSSLLTIKTASISPEAKKYSEDYLSGLKRLTAVEANNTRENLESNGDNHKMEPPLIRNPYPEKTDDSKSWYRSKLSDGKYSSQLLSENSEIIKRSSPRCITPVGKEDEELEVKQPVKNPEADLPGFLAKTPLVTDEKYRLEKDIHFESDFPTFSAYLKRTYGQTYQYRSREVSEPKSGRNANIERKSDVYGSLDDLESRKNKESERDRKAVNDHLYEYSISDMGSKKANDQQKYKEVEHISRKSKRNNEDRISSAQSVLDAKDQELADSQSFLSRSKEAIYESSGAAPANTECFNKQLIKNSNAVKCKVSKPDHRDASPTIDLLQQSFESLQSALTNKELELMSPSSQQTRPEHRRASPSPDRFPEPEERLSDSSRSRSRSRTKKRTIQSQPRSRESSQKMRLKEIAPTYYEAKYNSSHEPRTFDPDQRGHRMEEKMFPEKTFAAGQNPSPSLSEIEGIYKGSEPDNFGNMNKKYIERYPMDLNDEDISVMKKFIHHKKDELPSEMFYMDVETFKKLYVQNRVMEMKREASRSRRSSVSSNVNEPEQQDKMTSSNVPLDNTLAQESPWLGDKDHGYNQQSKNATSKTSSSPRHYQPSSNIGHTPIEYGSPKKKSVAVQMQEPQPQPPPPAGPAKSRSRHKTLVYGVAGDDMRMVHQAAAAVAGQPDSGQVHQVSSRSSAAAAGHLDGSQALPGQVYQVSSRSSAAAAGHLDGSQALPGPGQIYHQSHPRQRDCGAQVSQEDLEADAVKMAELERWQYEEVQKRDPLHQIQQQQQHHLTYSQKQALKDFDAYELKNLELENKKLTVINDDLLKLWEQTQAENTRLRLELSGVKNENETLKHQLGSAAQQVSQINAMTDAEKREKQIVLKKLAEMEEELKLLALSENLTDQTLDQLKADNARLRQENEALIRAMTGKQK